MKKRKEAIHALRERVKQKLREQRKTLVPPPTPPAYDEEFIQGVQWLDSLAGEQIRQKEPSPNFDVDSILETLRTINEKYQEGSPEDEAMRVAAVALLYVRESQKLEDYREFFRKFYTPAIDYVVVSRTFETRSEADEWLSSGEPVDGQLVRIAGQGFQVIPRRDGTGLRFLRTPLPEELMKKDPGEPR